MQNLFIFTTQRYYASLDIERNIRLGEIIEILIIT